MMATAHPNHAFISSDDVQGACVYDAAGKRLGTIDHLMIDKETGRIVFVILCFGGFLGIDHRHFPLAWETLNYDPSIGGYRASVEEQDLVDVPEFSDDSWSDRHGGVHSIYAQHGFAPYGF
jgi:PRC-barrel domain